jgi:hypothetical protein
VAGVLCLDCLGNGGQHYTGRLLVEQKHALHFEGNRALGDAHFKCNQLSVPNAIGEPIPRC